MLEASAVSIKTAVKSSESPMYKMAIESLDYDNVEFSGLEFGLLQ